ncbi:MAG: hypothetical protein ABI822_02090 [Bryobacteraceae bacterium]
MNSIFKTRTYLPMAAVLLTLALIGTARAGTEKQTLLAGAMQGQESDVFQGPPPGILLVNGTITGIAAHLGRFTLVYKVTVTLADGTAVGSGELIAANGDSIQATVAGSSTSPEPGIGSIVEIYTVTGGTGRFTGASGSFTVQRLVDLATGLTSGSLQGVVTAPAGAH